MLFASGGGTALPPGDIVEGAEGHMKSLDITMGPTFFFFGRNHPMVNVVYLSAERGEVSVACTQSIGQLVVMQSIVKRRASC